MEDVRAVLHWQGGQGRRHNQGASKTGRAVQQQKGDADEVQMRLSSPDLVAMPGFVNHKFLLWLDSRVV